MVAGAASGPVRVTVLVLLVVIIGVGALSQIQVPGAAVPINQLVEPQAVPPDVVLVTVTVMVAPGAIVVGAPPFTVALVTLLAACACPSSNAEPS